MSWRSGTDHGSGWLAWCAVRTPYGPAQQFVAGRRAAASALAAAGSAARFVPREPGGRPLFPPGFAGSISHTDRLAVAAVVPGVTAIGIDVENGAVGPRVAAFVLREDERRRLLAPAGEFTPRELFAAKEAAFKALYDTEMRDDPLFWRIGLDRADGALIAAYCGARVPVWVRSEADFAFALAIRR